MIYITGDTHIPLDMKKLELFSAENQMTKEDFLIICGDFGGVWDNSSERRQWLDELDKKSYTTLFIDGNHENFDLLNSYPVNEWCGGKVHFVRSGIVHLMRSQIFEIQGLTFFTMGGANSRDKMFRTPHKSWWAEEMPSAEEYNEARSNLKNRQWMVDYVLTHTAPLSIIQAFYEPFDELPMNLFLEEIKDKTAYKHWYFGHVHKDITVNDRFTAVYQRILKLK